MDFEFARKLNIGGMVLALVFLAITAYLVIVGVKEYKSYKRCHHGESSAFKDWVEYRFHNFLALIFAFLVFGGVSFAVVYWGNFPYTLDQSKAVSNIQSKYGITVEPSYKRIICSEIEKDNDCKGLYEYKVLDSEHAPELILVDFEDYREPTIMKRYGVIEANPTE